MHDNYTHIKLRGFIKMVKSYYRSASWWFILDAIELK